MGGAASWRLRSAGYGDLEIAIESSCNQEIALSVTSLSRHPTVLMTLCIPCSLILPSIMSPDAAPDLQIRAQPSADLQIGVTATPSPGHGDLEIAHGRSGKLEIALSGLRRSGDRHRVELQSRDCTKRNLTIPTPYRPYDAMHSMFLDTAFNHVS